MIRGVYLLQNPIQMSIYCIGTRRILLTLFPNFSFLDLNTVLISCLQNETRWGWGRLLCLQGARSPKLRITTRATLARVGNDWLFACIHQNQHANFSKPTECMNHSIASTLPRTWQDINESLDPTAASNWQLSSIKRYTSESRPSQPPLRSQPSSFHWRKVMTKLHCLMYFNLGKIGKIPEH